MKVKRLDEVHGVYFDLGHNKVLLTSKVCFGGIFGHFIAITAGRGTNSSCVARIFNVDVVFSEDGTVAGADPDSFGLVERETSSFVGEGEDEGGAVVLEARVLAAPRY